MGRRRKIKLQELDARTMWCKCGKPVDIIDKSVESVTCVYCATNMRPIPEGYDEDIIAASKEIVVEIERKKSRKRGRPAGAKNKKTLLKEKQAKVKVEKPEAKPKMVKEKKMKVVKKTEAKGKGKRGRKPSVGAKVLQYINEQKSEVRFDEILNVYSSERERLGKKSTPQIEKRNCLSTLFIMQRDGKIREIKRKEVYASI